MARYVTEAFELNNDDVLWEKFMCFMRAIIPYEETVLTKLSETQNDYLYSPAPFGIF